MSAGFPHQYAVEALTHLGNEPCLLEASLFHWWVIGSTVQLALRHPNVPPEVRTLLEYFLAQLALTLERRDPVLAAAFRAGNDPTQDVPSAEGHP